MIQQATTQLGQTITGGALAAGYAFGQTPWGQLQKEKVEAKLLKKRSERLQNIVGEMDEAKSDEYIGDIYEKSRDLDVKIAELDPTPENVKRASDIYEERKEEKEAQARIDEKKRQKEEQSKIARETELARQTIQDTILRGGYETANSQQTMKYQEALEFMRKQGGNK